VKKFLIFISVVLVLGSLGFYLVEFHLLGWLPRKRVRVERTYPQKIKLAYVNLLSMHGPLSGREAEVLLRGNLRVQGSLATNTYNLDDGYEYRNGRFIKRSDIRKNTVRELLAVKNAGMAVRLVSSWGRDIPRFANLTELRKFLDDYADFLVREAEFAEEYGVEYLGLSEVDHLIWAQPFNTDEATVAAIVNDFKENTIPRIRRVYRGRLDYQIGDAGEWDFTQLDVSGLDHFGVLIGGMCDFDFWKQKVDEIFSKAERLSVESGVPWVISELWINKRYDEGTSGCDLSGKRGRYYDYVFQKAAESKNLVGIMIDSWNIDEPGFETSVEGTKEEQIIKSGFESWN